jgi:hypothetical protein
MKFMMNIEFTEITGLYRGISSGSHLFSGMYINLSTTCTEKNNMCLHIKDSLRRPKNLDLIKSYAADIFESLGGVLEIASWDYSGEKMYPLNIRVAGYANARKVIDAIFAIKEMTPEQRSNIEEVLRKLEKSGYYATRRSDQISLAQKDLIQSMVLPYVDGIKAEIVDRKSIKYFLDVASVNPCVNALEFERIRNARQACEGVYAVNEPKVREWRPFMPKNELSLKKSDNFYDCLSCVARFYSSYGNIEGALEQLGKHLPSEILVQQAILELFDNE